VIVGPTAKNPCFSADDLFDAFALFSYLLIRSARKKCDFSGIYKEHSVAIRNLLSLEDYEAAKFREGIIHQLIRCRSNTEVFRRLVTRLLTHPQSRRIHDRTFDIS
jgi:hypothetical protein